MQDIQQHKQLRSVLAEQTVKSKLQGQGSKQSEPRGRAVNSRAPLCRCPEQDTKRDSVLLGSPTPDQGPLLQLLWPHALWSSLRAGESRTLPFTSLKSLHNPEHRVIFWKLGHSTQQVREELLLYAPVLQTWAGIPCQTRFWISYRAQESSPRPWQVWAGVSEFRKGHMTPKI